jgi:phage shock protein C
MARARLTRSTDNKIFAGVCGGLAQHFGISSTRIRWAFVIFGLFGAGEVVYLILWILVPKAS